MRTGLLRAIGRAFFPPVTCALCGEELREGDGGLLCANCREKLPKNDGTVCEKCGRKTVTSAKFCLSCRAFPHAFSEARSAYVYEGAARTLIHRLKYRDERYLAALFGEGLAGLIAPEDRVDAAAFVPMRRGALWARGYNQAELLARDFSARTGVMLIKALEKCRRTGKQRGLSGAERRENLKGAFCVKGGAGVKGLHIALVDDVLTTGSTADACAEALLSGGAKSVLVLTACATPEKPLD